MSIPTEAQITRALDEIADPLGNGRWRWPGNVEHGDEESRQIVRACLILGLPVSDLISAQLFSTMAERLAIAEERIARIEEHFRR